MYWPLSNMYSENFGFGLGFSIIRGTFNKRMKGLHTYINGYMRTCIHAYHYIAFTVISTSTSTWTCTSTSNPASTSTSTLPSRYITVHRITLHYVTLH